MVRSSARMKQLFLVISAALLAYVYAIELSKLYVNCSCHDCIASPDDSNQLHSHSRRSSDPVEFEEPTTYRIAAGTIYEALQGFWNPLTGDKMIPDLDIQYESADKDSGAAPRVRCASKRCLGCMQVFTDGLKENTTDLGLLRDAWLLVDKLGLGNVDYRHHCNSEPVHKKDMCYPPYEKDKGKGHILDEILKSKKYQCEARSVKRQKRKGPLEGYFMAMSCEEAGTVASNTGDLLNLCGRCWGVRTLPHRIKPAIVNEIRCKEDEAAKHKVGKCFEKHHKVSVLLKRRKKMKKPEFYTIDVGVGCEFSIPYHSVLENLVNTHTHT